jgi:hypothetical protein
VFLGGFFMCFVVFWGKSMDRVNMDAKIGKNTKVNFRVETKILVSMSEEINKLKNINISKTS